MTPRPTRIEEISPAPLVWPAEKPRTAPRDRRPKRWGDALPKCIGLLEDETKRAQIYDYKLSCNRRLGGVTSFVDGSDPGAALWFMQRVRGDWVLSVLACDAFRELAENVHAIALTIQRLRLVEDYGCYSSSEAMQGAAYDALPPPDAPPPPYWEILQVSPNSPMMIIEAAYKTLAKMHHPDAGGTVEDFQRIQDAFERAKKEAAA